MTNDVRIVEKGWSESRFGKNDTIKTYERCKSCIYENNNFCNFYMKTTTLKTLSDDQNCIRYEECEKVKEVKEVKEVAAPKKMTVEQSIYRTNIIEKLDKQIQKGIAKYGTTLEQNTWFTALDRLTYLQEELIDGMVYIEHIIAKLEKLNIDLD